MPSYPAKCTECGNTITIELPEGETIKQELLDQVSPCSVCGKNGTFRGMPFE